MGCWGRFAAPFAELRVEPLGEDVVSGAAGVWLAHSARRLAAPASGRCPGGDDDVACATLFLHPDFQEHVQLALWQRVWTALGRGSSGTCWSYVTLEPGRSDILLAKILITH